jgi:NAD(P)-dependent dehydrogenase (short-subunit alcohol dehydrogenase family)
MSGIAAVTGASSGIGRATARALLAAGWQVALIGRRRDALDTAGGGAPGALTLVADVADPEAVTRTFDAIGRRFGRLDLLFNNAGISVPGAPIDEIPVEDWMRLSATNITGMFLCARAAFGMMRRQMPQGGRIINNGSVSAHVPRPGFAPYTMSKHAVTGLTRQLALDGRPFGIAAGQIDIGNAASDMTAGFAAGMPQARGDTLAEPVMNVTHVATTVLHMASLPLDVAIPFVTVMARDMPYIGRG